MKPLYVLAPQAVLDLVEIWSYIKEHSTPATADRVESVILEKVAFLAKRQKPDTGGRT
jgi:plasmid stabilization system protein ParE